MSKRDEHDVAEALLAKAGGDEAGLRVLVDAPPLDRTEALATVSAVREWATDVIGSKSP